MATMGPNKSGSTSGIGGANDMQAAASLAVLAKIHAEVRADINPDLLNAIREHETANAAWLATSHGDLPTGTMEEKVADQVEKKLIHFPCHSHADVLAKVGYLYQQDTEAARAAHDTIQADYLDELLGSLIGLSMSEELDRLVEPAADPLLEAINAFRAELARFNAASLDSNEAAQELAAQTFEPRLKVLVEWDQPAITLDGAKEALRLMVEEIECFERPEALAPLLRAALGYLEGRPCVSAGCASTSQAVSIASPTIPEMYEEWLAIRGRDLTGMTDEEADVGYRQYASLQARIIAAEPQTPRDVAIMFMVDTDFTDSSWSGMFENKMRAFAEASPADPLLDLINSYKSGVAAWNAIPDGMITKDNEGELTRATYGEFQDALCEAAPAATSLAGVRAALQFAIDEDGFCDTIAEGVVRAALAYLDGRAA